MCTQGQRMPSALSNDSQPRHCHQTQSCTGCQQAPVIFPSEVTGMHSHIQSLCGFWGFELRSSFCKCYYPLRHHPRPTFSISLSESQLSPIGFPRLILPLKFLLKKSQVNKIPIFARCSKLTTLLHPAWERSRVIWLHVSSNDWIWRNMHME